MKKIVNDYIDNLEMKAKQSDKYFTERNELYIEKEKIKEVIKKWNNMSSISTYDLTVLLHEIEDIIKKVEDKGE
jgi:hypothetical protein